MKSGIQRSPCIVGVDACLVQSPDERNPKYPVTAEFPFGGRRLARIQDRAPSTPSEPQGAAWWLAILAVSWGTLASGAVEARAWSAAPFWALATLAGVAAFAEALAGSRVRASLDAVRGPGLMALLLVLWLAATRPGDSPAAAAVPRLLTLVAALCLAVAGFVSGRRFGHRTVWVLGGLGVVQAMLALLQATGILEVTGKNPPYPAGTYVNHNHLAGILEVAMLLLLARALLPARRADGATLAARYAVGAMALALVLCQSRGGWIAALAGGSILFLERARRQVSARQVVAGALVAATLAAFVVAAGGHQLAERAGSLQVDTLVEEEATRIGLWRASVRMVADHPLRGVGVGGFRDAFQAYRPPGLVVAPRHAHNDYLQVAVEGGLPALLLLLALVASLVRGLLAGRGEAQGAHSLCRCQGALAVLVAVVVHAFVDFNGHIPANLGALALVLGTGLGAVAPQASLPARPWGPALVGASLLVPMLTLWMASGFTQAEASLEASASEAEAGRLAAAVDRAREALEAMPISGRACKTLASTLEAASRRSDGALARRYLEAACEVRRHQVALAPRDLRARAELAALEVQLASIEALAAEGGGALAAAVAEPLQRLQAVVEAAPEDPVVMRLHARALVIAGREAEGQDALRASLQSTPRYELKRLLVLPYLQAGALDMLEDLLPDDYLFGWVQLARAATAEGRTGIAERAWDRSRALAPDDLEVRLGRGRFLASLARFKEALVDLEVVRSIEERDLPIEFYRAYHQVLGASGQIDAALAVAREASERFPEQAEWWSAIGGYMESLGATHRALSVYEELAHRFPEAPEGPMSLAVLLIEQGRRFRDRRLLRRACSQLREALHRAPADDVAVRRLSELYFELGDWDRSLPLLESLRDRGLAEARDYLRLAQAYSKLGRPEDAGAILDSLEDPDQVIDGRTLAEHREDLVGAEQEASG